MEVLYPTILLQALVTVFLLISNPKPGSEDYFLTLLMSCFLLHIVFKYWLLHYTRNEFLYEKIHGSFILLYGPLLLFYLKAITRETISTNSKLIHLIPFFVGFAFNIFLTLEAIYLNDSVLVDPYNSYLQPAALISLLGYSRYTFKKSLFYRGTDQALKHKFSISLIIAMVLNVPFLTILMRYVFDDFFFLDTRTMWYTAIIFMFAAVLHFRFKIFVVLSPSNHEKENKDEFKEDVASAKKYQTSGLQQEDADLILTILKSSMLEGKLYKDCELSLESLAIRLQIPKHHISQVLNDFVHTNFYHFINHYRIEEAKSLIKTNDSNAGLLSIAFESGFKSKSTFNKYFKEFTGKSPSEFREEIFSHSGMVA